MYDKAENKIEIRIFGIRIRLSLSIGKFIIKNLPFIFYLLDYIVPKNDKKIVFNSEPDFSDNAYAYFKYIQKYHKDEYECFWITQPGANTNFAKNAYTINSLKSIYHILTSKYFVTTHSSRFINFAKSKRHINMCLWHGMPLKKLGLNEYPLRDDLKTYYETLGQNAYFFVTSDVFKLFMIPCFNADYSRLYITGQPRTDMIFSDDNKDKLQEFFGLNNFSKTIFYMPTYKENLNVRVKQTSKEYTNIFYFDDYDEQQFINYLEENNILFIMKPHPYDENFYKEHLDTIPKSKNFKLVFNEDFVNEDIYSYELFKYVDLMISDFSSVTLDYLILNRPVIYLNNLTDEYGECRGMILPDNTEFFMPGVKTDSLDSLIKALNENLYEDKYKQDREKILPLVHKYRDDKASERVYEIMRSL